MHSSQPLQTPAKNGRLCNGKFSNQNNLSDFDPCRPQGLGASNYPFWGKESSFDFGFPAESAISGTVVETAKFRLSGLLSTARA